MRLGLDHSGLSPKPREPLRGASTRPSRCPRPTSCLRTGWSAERRKRRGVSQSTSQLVVEGCGRCSTGDGQHRSRPARDLRLARITHDVRRQPECFSLSSPTRAASNAQLCAICSRACACAGLRACVCACACACARAPFVALAWRVASKGEKRGTC
jgi:hypothetical protein